MHSGLAQLFPYILHKVRQSCAWRCCSLYTRKYLASLFSGLCLLCSGGVGGGDTEREDKWKVPAERSLGGDLFVNPGTECFPQESSSRCSQERLAPLSYMISLCLFLYLLFLSLTMQGSGQDGWEHGWYQHVATSLQPQLPNPTRLCPLQTCWDHGTQKPVSLDKERSRCWEQLGKIQMSGPRAWQCCQGGQDELCEIGMKEIPAKCRIDTVKMQGASLMWNRSWAWTISAYLYTAVAYADELRANTLENKVKSKKLRFCSTV